MVSKVSKRQRILTRSNIESEIQNYLDVVNSIKFPDRKGTNLEYMISLKRDPIGSGPYEWVSIYEASNRIFSDIVILFGIRHILLKPQIGSVSLPFDKYEVKFGAEDGFDIMADNGKEKLAGEAFNVAKKYFSKKRHEMKNKLEAANGYDYKILIFNSDAIARPQKYILKSSKEMIFLPINWQKDLEEFNKISKNEK